MEHRKSGLNHRPPAVSTSHDSVRAGGAANSPFDEAALLSWLVWSGFPPPVNGDALHRGWRWQVRPRYCPINRRAKSTTMKPVPPCRASRPANAAATADAVRGTRRLLNQWLPDDRD